jgi:hypothetical protein
MPIFIPLISPQSPSPIIRGWYNRPVVAAVPKSPTAQILKKNYGTTQLFFRSDMNTWPPEYEIRRLSIAVIATRCHRVIETCGGKGVSYMLFQEVTTETPKQI